ncbi:polymorphic toxin type 8 domain-containing protein, partial [Salegentibacter salinarum]
FGTMDYLDYDYDGNKLLRVSEIEDGEAGYGFKDGNTTGDDYGYDVNGNLTSDANKGILAGGIKYNHLNLPTEVMFNNSSSQVIKYTYDATGVKLRKEIPGKITDYAGNFIYEGGTLKFFNHPEGYVSYDGGQFNYVYNYVDHLGNIRLSYTDANQNNTNPVSLQIIQEKNYYPFGLTHQGYNTNGSPLGNDAAKRYGFGGKELQDENISGSILDWYDVSARNYDPALGRWMNLDPLAEKMRRHSPYNFGFNNPIYFQDYDGMAPSGPGNPIKKLIKKAVKKLGRLGRQNRLRQVVNDPKASKADKGWIKSEMNQMKNGKRKSIRNPPGKDLAHERGREAAKGYDYKHSNLQDRDLHRTQHKYDNNGRKNKERPVKEATATAVATGTMANEEVNASTEESTSITGNETADAVLDISMTYVETMDNLGTVIFGDNDFGKAVNEFNPFPGFSEFFSILKDDNDKSNTNTK